MVNVDSTGVLHAARQKGISDGAEEHDGKNDQILTKSQSNIPESEIKTNCYRGASAELSRSWERPELGTNVLELASAAGWADVAERRGGRFLIANSRWSIITKSS